MVIGFEFWQGFGELRISVGGLGSMLGFGKFGASKRAWAPNVLARVLSSRILGNVGFEAQIRVLYIT